MGKIVPQDAEFAGFNLLLLAPAPPSASTVPIETETTEAQGPEPEPKTEDVLGNSREEKLAYDAILVTNHGAGGRLEARRLTTAERACGCMSNGIDGQGGNEWPKVKRASKDFGEALQALSADGSLEQTERELINHLFRILTYVYPSSYDTRCVLTSSIGRINNRHDIVGDLQAQLRNGMNFAIQFKWHPYPYSLQA